PGADRRGSADVDILDDLVARCVLRHGFFERVEVDHHQVDRTDIVRLHRGDVLGIVADGEQAAMDLWVERLDPTVHYLRKAGNFANFTDLVTKFAKFGGGTTRRYDFDPCPAKTRSQRVEPGLVGKRDERSADRHDVGHVN